jgi:hypothetical protein
MPFMNPASTPNAFRFERQDLEISPALLSQR